MKITAVAALSILSCVAVASADFILVQEQEQVHPGGTNKNTITTRVKGEKVRIDHEPLSVTTIMDHAAGTHLGIFHHNKTYREISASQQKESLEGVVDSLEAKGKIPDERPRLRATGKKDVISGWKAEEYVSETKSMKATYWLAKELLSFHLALLNAVENPRLDRINQQFPDAKLFPGMPVLMILEQETPMGKMKSTTKVVSIKEVAIADAEFAIPKGYKKQ